MTKAKTIPLAKAKPGDFAFWPYDQFPGWLGGEIGGLPEGWAPRPMVDPAKARVWIGSYAGYFQPDFILTGEDGKALKAELYALRELHFQVHREVHQKLKEAAAARLARFPIKGSPDA